MRNGAARGIAVACAALLLGAAPAPRIDEWWAGETGARFYEKVLVVGITTDSQVRRHFENKFVSHLRSRRIEGVTSYSLVPDLGAAEDREKVLRAIEDLQITGVVALRLFPLGKGEEEAWAAGWKASLRPDLTLREVVRDTAPADLDKVKQAAIEVGIWDAASRKLVWAGRTGASSRKQLRGGGGTFVSDLLDLLEDQKVIIRPVPHGEPGGGGR